MQNTSPFLTAEHEMYREQLQKFVRREIVPNVEDWEEAGRVPRLVYKKAAQAGVLGLGFPEEWGGFPGDRLYAIVLQQELARGGAGGVVAALLSHTISMPAVVREGSAELQQRVLPAVLAGEKIAALACTEPTGGSDVAALRTTARREGSFYVLDGEKTFISSGMQADFFVVVVRTGGAGIAGLSLLLVEGDAKGLSRAPLKKTGWLSSDTATLYFDQVRVPVANLIGIEGRGFNALTKNFNDERLGMAASSIAFANLAYEEALAWARMRTTFGRPLVEHQVLRHKLVDMFQAISASQAYLEKVAWCLDSGMNVVADVCMLKNQATKTLAFCASEAVQILGGAGYLKGSNIERIYREVKVNAIGGGTEEIMKELAARQLEIGNVRGE
tara:strand:+ start:127650 stop:128810 length:1161 start_codon:yes stop_codon:yes gene_type:complete